MRIRCLGTVLGFIFSDRYFVMRIPYFSRKIELIFAVVDWKHHFNTQH